MGNLSEKFYYIFLSIIPLSIIIGPAVSLINIIILSIIYLYYFFRFNHLSLLKKNNTIKIFLILYLYLIFNSFISLNFETSAPRNFGFIRFILFFLAINYLFYINEKNISIFNFWTIILFFLIFDVYFERINGANILGWEGNYGNRVVSFFKDEPIAAAFINGFIFILSAQMLNFFKKKKFGKIIFLILLSIIFMSVLITGERSNTIKAVFGLILFISLIDVYDFKTKFIFFIALPTIMIITIFNSDYLKNRYYGQIISKIYKEKNINTFNDNIYIKLYRSGYSVFKNYPLTGVGNKNYRIETCSNAAAVKKNKYYCLTHPHQVYFEFLSEHGLIGTIVILYIFFLLIFKNLRVIINSQNYLQIGAFTFLICNFLPFIPSGSFFSDFNMSLFILNLSILYAVNKKTNIFFKESSK